VEGKYFALAEDVGREAWCCGSTMCEGQSGREVDSDLPGNLLDGYIDLEEVAVVADLTASVQDAVAFSELAVAC
jgi:hypothetical protein